MPDIKEFEELLYGIKISSIDTQDSAESQLRKCRNWIINNIPKKLYRFRKYNEYSISALKNDEIWGSRICTFNDPYECTPCYNYDLLIKQIEKEMSPEYLSDFLKNIQNDEMKNFYNSVFNEETYEKILRNSIKMIDGDRLYIICEKFKQLIYSYILKNYKSLSDKFFEGIYKVELSKLIACFSEDVNSSLMWGHYADSHKGFCLEYDFTQIIKPCKGCKQVIGCNNLMLEHPIAPVIYSENRFDATSYLATTLQYDLFGNFDKNIKPYYHDTEVVLKTLLTKSTVWNYEKEWRLFSSHYNSSEDHSLIFKLKPTAVYLGVDMPSSNADEIYNICNTKNIECYKMMLEYTSLDYKLDSKPYIEFEKLFKNK